MPLQNGVIAALQKLNFYCCLNAFAWGSKERDLVLIQTEACVSNKLDTFDAESNKEIVCNEEVYEQIEDVWQKTCEHEASKSSGNV